MTNSLLSRLPSLLAVVVLMVLPLLASGLTTGTADAAEHGTDTRRVRLVRGWDGSLTVQTGTTFARAGGVVVAEEADSVLHVTGGLTSTLLDTVSGLVADEYRPSQWNLDAVAAETVWQVASGEGQVIAIVDSGIDGTHPDLRDRLVDGWSAVGGSPLVDGLGHGTHVAGTAAASVGGGFGVVGLAPEADLMSVKVTDAQGAAYASSVAQGVIWATDHGATVINMSLAGTVQSHVLDAAIAYAVDNGVVVVVAAGNEHDRGNPRTYPGSHPDVIAVGALRTTQQRASFSSTGDWVDVAAPGASVLSTVPGDGFGFKSGTSMASPLVAAGAALLLSLDSSLSVEQVYALLTSSAVDLGSRGWDAEFGHGSMDVVAAVTQLTGQVPGQVLEDIEDPTGFVEEAPETVERTVPARHFHR